MRDQSPQGEQARPRQQYFSQEPEKLYEEGMHLKATVNTLREENLKLKTRINILEKEAAKFEKMVMEKATQLESGREVRSTADVDIIA